MKNFTRLLSLVTLSILANVAVGQYDVAVTNFVIPSLNDSVSPNYSAPVVYTLKNTGTNTIAQGDTFTRVVTGNGVAIVGPDVLIMGADIAPGDSVNLTASSGYYNFAGAGSIDVCVEVFLANPETDSSNNEFCRTFTVTNEIAHDMAIKDLTLVTPEIGDLDDFDIKGGKIPPTITDMNFMLINQSDLAIFGRNFEVDISLGTESYIGYLNDISMNPGDSLEISINETSIIPATPTTVGNYSLCVDLDYDDDNNNNHESCVNFKIKDSTEPIGIADAQQNELSIFSANGQVNIAGIVEPENVIINDMQGRTVASTMMTTDGSVPMTATSAGIYMVQSTNTVSGITTVSRVSVQ